MPYIDDRPEDEEKDGLQLGGGTVSPGTAPVAGAPAAPATPAAPAAASGGGVPGRFVNFQRFFDANKDAATNLGTQTADKVQKAGDEVQNDLTRRQGAFGTEVKTGMGAAGLPATAAPVAAAPETPGRPRSAPVAPARGIPAGPAVPPPAAAPSAQPVEYKGPEKLSDASGWSDLFGKARKGDEQLRQTTSGAGLQSLLQKQTGATAGQSRFDAGLVGAASGGRFEQLRQRFGADVKGGGLSKGLETADTASAADSAAAKGTVQTYNDKLAADQKKIDDARRAEFDAKRAAEPPTKPQDVGAMRKQWEEDNKTNAWMSKIMSGLADQQGFLGLEGWRGEAAETARRKGEKTGDWSDYVKLIDEKYGPGVGNEWLNAWKDTAGRKKRAEAMKNTGTLGTTQMSNTGLNPFFEWLYREQLKRNADPNNLNNAFDTVI